MGALRRCEREDWLLWDIWNYRIGDRKNRIMALCEIADIAVDRYVNEKITRDAVTAARKYADNMSEENRSNLLNAYDAAERFIGETKTFTSWHAALSAKSAAWASLHDLDALVDAMEVASCYRAAEEIAGDEPKDLCEIIKRWVL